jgi:ABC-2 type transport system ATP-binding protein
MSIIQVSNLKKYYQVHQKEPGLFGSIKSLVKRDYETVKAVDNISFKIEKGELLGFIGPNGAGKTTTLKCLSGLLYPDAGQVSVLGYEPWQRKPDFLKNIAFVMGQKNQLWWDLPPIETFALNKAVYQIPEEEYQQTLDELVALLEVKDIIRKQTRKLSLGQRMKCELIAALLHQPPVLFLDEPTIGLDVVMQKKIRDFIKEYNQRYKSTIILTSHYMEDVRQLAKRVIIIDKGKIAFDGKLEKITQKYADHKFITVTLKQEKDKQKLERIAEIEDYSYPQVTFKVPRDQASAKASQILEQLDMEDMNIEAPPIENIIRELFTNKDYA